MPMLIFDKPPDMRLRSVKEAWDASPTQANWAVGNIALILFGDFVLEPKYYRAGRGGGCQGFYGTGDLMISSNALCP